MCGIALLKNIVATRRLLILIKAAQTISNEGSKMPEKIEINQ